MDKGLKQFLLPPGWRLERAKNQKPLLFTQEGLSLSLDFSQKKALLPGQALVKAIGFKGSRLSVLDITAGWAKEAFLISQLGCFVTAIEASAFVFHFVQESLAKDPSSFLHKKEDKPRLQFIQDDSFNYLNQLKKEDFPDVIYMDPMFGERKKSLSKKELRILKQLVGETKNQKELFHLALKIAKKRLVVKRHHLDPPLHKNRLCTFKGRSVCYDVFTAKNSTIKLKKKQFKGPI